MAQETFFANEATNEKSIQQIEQHLSHLNGVERVLMDTTDGEVKIEFNADKITREEIMSVLQQLH